MKEVIIILIVVALIMVQVFIGQWCCHNTELLASHHLQKTITLPRTPFVLGAIFTQFLGLPYAIITEIWCHCVGAK